MNPPVRIKVQRLTPTAKLPKRATPGSAGLDLYADQTTVLFPGETCAISTGLAIELIEGYEAQVRSRSGLARMGVVVTNSPGTIDSDYRGEVMVLLTNHSPTQTIKITQGDRIAQLVIQRVEACYVEEGAVDTNTERGDGGFGSTGR